jgi:hypothetical protein
VARRALLRCTPRGHADRLSKVFLHDDVTKRATLS